MYAYRVDDCLHHTVCKFHTFPEFLIHSENVEYIDLLKPSGFFIYHQV